MQANRHSPAELFDLMEAFCLDEITTDQAGRLDELVRSDRDAATTFAKFLFMHALAEQCEAANVLDIADSIIDKVRTDEPNRRILGAPPLNTHNVSQRRPQPLSLLARTRLMGRNVSVFATLGVAVIVYGAFGFLVWQMSRHKPTPHQPKVSPGAVATILGATDVQWSHSTSHQADNSLLLCGESLKIESGTIEVELETGTTLVVEGPAHWSIERDNRATLKSGKIVANVPPQAIGFMIETPQAKIVDLGTEFGVSVDERGATETQVFNGTVEIETLDKETPSARQDKQRQTLVAGEAARIDIHAKVPYVKTAVAKPDQFKRRLSSSASKQAHEPSAYATNVIEKTKPELYWSFDAVERDILKDLVQSQTLDVFNPLSVQAGPRPSDTFAEMSPSNRAVGMTTHREISLHELNHTYQIATSRYSIQMWFSSSIAFGSQAHHFLVSRGNGKTGVQDVCDTVFVAGNYTPHQNRIATGHLGFVNSAANPETEIFAGKTELQPNHWYLLTLVRDRDRVHIYLDGELEIDVQSPWHGGDGNFLTFGQRVDLLGTVVMTGRLDEIAIWDRALSAEEIRNSYKLARGSLPNAPRDQAK
jgi:hypothetical protein